MFIPITDGLWLFFLNIFLVTNDMIHHVYNFELTKNILTKLFFKKILQCSPSHKNVELAIDCFFVNKHIFFTTISTKICFTTITHMTKRNKGDVWVALLATYKMYLMRGFRIVVVKGDQEFASISDLVAGLPTMPRLDWAAASQHCGLIERNIRFLKEKIRSLRHSVPFEQVPGIMVVRMVLHVVKFVNGFPRKGGPKLYSPGEIMTDRRLHADDLRLGFGTYCQVAEHVEPRNSLAPRTRAAISLGNSGNLSGGQVFLALDTGHTITRHQWVVLPMPPAVIARVNVLGKAEPSILTFTDRHGRVIGDYPQDEPVVDDDGNFEYDYIDDFLVESQDDNEIPGVPEESPDEPTGVEMDPVDPEPNETNFDVQDGLEQEPQETSHEPGTARRPTGEPTAAPVQDPAPPSQGMAARNARVRKPPEKYVPTLKGNKYAVALTQITKSLKKSKHGVAMAQMSVKLMSKGEHRKADIVGKVMAQLSMKAAIKKWGAKAQFAISKEMKQLHWRNSYVPKHYHTLTKKQKDQLLESHIFVEEKRDGTIKARKVIGGNKQRDYITKQDVSSPTVTAEAVMLTCVIDAQENRDVAVVDIPNAFVQTVVSDEDAEHRVMVRIRGPLVDILVSMAPDVYGPYVSVTKTGQKVLIVECLNAVYGTMVAALLYYKKFVKSLKSKAFKLNPYDGCVANKIVKGKQITICFHVDDCKISHEVPQVIDETIDWLKAEYESIFEDGSGEMKVHRGKVHKYLGMSLDFTNKGQCIVTMNDYLAEIVVAYDSAIAEHNDGFLPVTKQRYETPAPDNLFTVNEDCEKLPKEMAADFHTIVAKMLYVTKRARPDTCLSVAFLTTRVRAPDRDDWEKLRHLMEYLRKDNVRPLVLGADNDGLLMWYVDASFAVHPNMRGHTGGGLTMGRGFPISTSTKQKLNTRSSTESELVGVDDMMPIIIWTRHFLLSQGYGIVENLLLQDNRSSILMERNGRASSSKRTRHINIRYFFVCDRVNMKEISLQWCPTKEMIADFWTKPLQGSHFRKLRDYIMGRVRCVKPKGDAVSIKTKVSGLRRSAKVGIEGRKIMPQ